MYKRVLRPGKLVYDLKDNKDKWNVFLRFKM